MLKEKIRSYCGIANDVKVFVHNKTSEEDVELLIKGIGYGHKRVEHDISARILAYTKSAVAYRSDNCIYFIPARKRELPLAVTHNKGEKPCVHVSFDYPCEMREEDLEEY